MKYVLVATLALAAIASAWFTLRGIRTSPEIAAEAILQKHQDDTLHVAFRDWRLPKHPTQFEQVAVLPRPDGSHSAFYRTELPEGERGSLFSIRIRLKDDGAWYLVGGPTLAKEIR